MDNQDRKKGDHLTAGVENLNNQGMSQLPERALCVWAAVWPLFPKGQVFEDL